MSPVSQILAKAIKFLSAVCPGLRLIVSYADKDQNHHGGIYQATNWIYEGLFGEVRWAPSSLKGKRFIPEVLLLRV
ncbi:Mom family adenine methylcarbamoylation protein [Serratia entomophila]